MTWQRQHIVQRYEDDLLQLHSLMEQMGGLVEHQLSLVLTGLAEHDVPTAMHAVGHDKSVDALEHQVEKQAIRLLALHGPMAADLRGIVATIPMSGALERMGDYACSIARRLNQMEQPIPRQARLGLHEMGRMVLEHLRRVMDAFEHMDAQEAQAIWQADQLVDQYGEKLTRDCLTQMPDNPHSIHLHIALLFIIRNLERIGDHTTTLAERVVFIVTGRLLPATRPHGHELADGELAQPGPSSMPSDTATSPPAQEISCP